MDQNSEREQQSNGTVDPERRRAMCDNVVVMDVFAQCVGTDASKGSSLMQATLRYEARDPYTVTVTFRIRPPEDVVTWEFARDLLADGMVDHVGLGDIRVWPGRCTEGPVVRLMVMQDPEFAVFEVPRHTVSRFLARTFAVVDRGEEGDYLDLDSDIGHLLDEGW